MINYYQENSGGKSPWKRIWVWFAISAVLGLLVLSIFFDNPNDSYNIIREDLLYDDGDEFDSDLQREDITSFEEEIDDNIESEVPREAELERILRSSFSVML